MTTRRQFLQIGAAGGAALFLPWAQAPVVSALTGGQLEKFLEPLPLPGAGMVVATPSGTNQYSFSQTPLSRRLHPQLPPTPIWAYDDGSRLAGQAGSFGMVLVAQSGTPLAVSFTNRLPERYPAWIPVDTRLTPLGNQVQVLTHLHGGFVAADSDGNPALRPNGFGPGETQRIYYPNQPPETPATLLWFHDHGLGVTRPTTPARLRNFSGNRAYSVPTVCLDRSTEPTILCRTSSVLAPLSEGSQRAVSHI